MNKSKWFVVLVINILVCASSLKAQDVLIDLPLNFLVNRTEFVIEKNVMNTQGSSHWRAGAINPTMRAVSQSNYRHTTRPALTLPSEVLHWRLASIGGQKPPFSGGGVWPGFKWFTTSDQTWFHPTIFSSYTAGNIDFIFKIPSGVYNGNAFYAGDYSMQVTQNYGWSSLYAIQFSPGTFDVILSVPAFISWVSNNPGKYITVSSLNSYRQASGDFVIDLGVNEIANSVDFKFRAKTASSTIQYTSSKGITTTKNFPEIKLGSSNPRISSLPLTSTWKDYNTGTKSITVEAGNRNNIPLNASISAEEFKNQFFEAGTYQFQLNLNARSTDNSISEFQQTEVVLKVLPLSEINILSGGNAVNFEFNTAEKYKMGDTKVIPDQVRISNNEPYELYVKSDASFFKRSGIQSQIPSIALEVGVEGSSVVPLSTVAKKIINNGKPVLDKDLNMKYSISSEAAQSMAPLEKGVYSINVIYSFTAL